MAIKAKFNIDKLFEGVYAKVEVIQKSVLGAIEKACINTVEKARSLNTYSDRTGVLRSSIGYVIYDHGEKVAENFELKNGPEGSGEEGEATGKAMALQVAESWPNCIVAVIVAGADYALYVESKGLDVLTGPCNELEDLLKQNIEDAIDTLKNG